MSNHQYRINKRSFPMTVIRYILVILSCTLSFYVSAQRDETILPFGLNYKLYDRINTIEMPPIDSVAIRKQEQKFQHTKNPYLAYNFKTNFSPHSNDGHWGTYSQHVTSWHLKLQSKGAYSITVVLSNVKLMPGEKLFIYNLHGISGSFDQATIPKSGVLPLGFLMGDEIVIEFDTPSTATTKGTFVIETVSHAYRDMFKAEDATALRNKESNCYLCLEGDTLQQYKRSVVRMVVHQDSATKVCTGTLMNNTARDRRPFILTAEHCISNQAEAEHTVFTFNYDRATCNASTPMETMTLTGSSYLASMYEHDFSIVELNDYPPLGFTPYYAGWDITDKARDYVMCIHHPWGRSKEVSIFNGTVIPHNFDDHTSRTPNAFWRISEWDAGVTEGGSSGAPLFNINNAVIGTLTGGSAYCSSPFNDYFQRLSQSWEPSTDINRQLKYWLDPISSGLKSLKGMDPFRGINPACDRLTNIQPDEFTTLIAYTPGSGYYSGYNSDNIASYAEKFYTADSILLTGSTFGVGSVNQNSQGGILVSVHQSDQGLPGSVLFETYVPYYKLSSSKPNYIAFYPYVKIGGTFFISYTLSYSPEDTFAVQQTPWRDGVTNTAFVKLQAGWVAMKNISPQAMGTSLQIEAHVCTPTSKNVPQENNPQFSIYPNPASSMLIIKFKEKIPEKFELQIFDLQGRTLPVNYHSADNNLLISISALSSGMYIARFPAKGKLYQIKFFKIQ